MKASERNFSAGARLVILSQIKVNNLIAWYDKGIQLSDETVVADETLFILKPIMLLDQRLCVTAQTTTTGKDMMLCGV